jgi:hypothetical protein
MKRFLALVSLALVGASFAFADETSEIYQMLYQQAEGLQQKYAAAVNLVGLDDKATAPILAAALEDLLLSQQSYSAPGDQDLYGATARIIAQALGDYKYLPAAPFLWDVTQQVPDPLAKAEATIAIGKMRALDYVEGISLHLRDLNLRPAADADVGEKLAYGDIIALDKFKDVRGFSPVFFATDAWYSLRVRQQALQSLPNIALDPTDPIKAILGTESADRMLRALKAETESKAANDRKIETAVLALNLGHLKAAVDKNEAKVYGDLRKLALRSLIAYRATGPDSVDGCASSYAKGGDDEERLLALAALGINAEDEASRTLRDIILKLNDDQKAGISDENRTRMARAAIESAGATKNKILKPALLAVSINNKWSGSVMLAAQTALKAMP